MRDAKQQARGTKIVAVFAAVFFTTSVPLAVSQAEILWWGKTTVWLDPSPGDMAYVEHGCMTWDSLMIVQEKMRKNDSRLLAKIHIGADTELMCGYIPSLAAKITGQVNNCWNQAILIGRVTDDIIFDAQPYTFWKAKVGVTEMYVWSPVVWSENTQPPAATKKTGD